MKTKIQFVICLLVLAWLLPLTGAPAPPFA